MEWLLDADREAGVRADNATVRELTADTGPRRRGGFGLDLTDGYAGAVGRDRASMAADLVCCVRVRGNRVADQGCTSAAERRGATAGIATAEGGRADTGGGTDRAGVS